MAIINLMDKRWYSGPLSDDKEKRVKTPDGIGTIKVSEIFSGRGEYRIGILHDTYPKNRIKGMYKDNILYYFLREVDILT